MNNELHIITKDDELADRILRVRGKEAKSIDLRNETVDYEELLRAIFENEHVHVW